MNDLNLSTPACLQTVEVALSVSTGSSSKENSKRYWSYVELLRLVLVLSPTLKCYNSEHITKLQQFMTFTAELGVLPWNGTEVRVIKNLTTLFEKNGLGNSARYLPKQTTLFADKDIDGELIDNFINLFSHFKRFNIKLIPP